MLKLQNYAHYIVHFAKYTPFFLKSKPSASNLYHRGLNLSIAIEQISKLLYLNWNILRFQKNSLDKIKNHLVSEKFKYSGAKHIRMAKKQEITEQSEIFIRALHYFFSFPEKPIGLNSLAKSIKASKTSAKKAASLLIKKGLISKEELGKAWRLSAEYKSPSFILKKIPYNLQKVYESGILKQVHNKLPNARAIILFGSYRWGTDTEKSDIDIAAEIPESRELKIETLATLKSLGFRKNIKVSLHTFSRDRTNINLFNNIANGIILDGLLEVRP